MTQFTSNFDPRSGPQRHKMLGTIIALSTEIETGQAFSSKGSILSHLKTIGWLPKSVRRKEVGLALLVDQAVQGWGYVPKGRVKEILDRQEVKS